MAILNVVKIIEKKSRYRRLHCYPPPRRRRRRRPRASRRPARPRLPGPRRRARPPARGRHQTTSALLAAVGVASAVATGIVYGLFHRAYNPSLAVGPCLVLFNLVLHAALSAFFIWRYWSGQAPVQPQPAGSRPNDIYTIFFIYVKPALWMIVNAIALVWPRQVLQWAVPAFLGTTAAPIYENPATICYFRVGSILALAASACVPLGLARADADTTRRSFVAKTAFLIALIWNYGNMLRRYPAASLASAPVVVLALLVADALSNVALLHASGASKSAPAAAGPAPYAYA